MACTLERLVEHLLSGAESSTRIVQFLLVHTAMVSTYELFMLISDQYASLPLLLLSLTPCSGLIPFLWLVLPGSPSYRTRPCALACL